MSKTTDLFAVSAAALIRPRRRMGNLRYEARRDVRPGDGSDGFRPMMTSAKRCPPSTSRTIPSSSMEGIFPFRLSPGPRGPGFLLGGGRGFDQRSVLHIMRNASPRSRERETQGLERRRSHKADFRKVVTLVTAGQ